VIVVSKRRPRGAARALALVAALAAAGCGDFGASLPPAPAPGTGGPSVETLIPARTFPGDTLVVAGSGFGELEGAVFFAGTLRADVGAEILAWSDDSIRVLVPAMAASGPVRVRAGGLESEGASFEIAPEISFAGDVVPLVQGRYGCTGCHAYGAAEGGFEVLPYESLVASTAVLPRFSGSSRLRQRLLSSTPVSERMPDGGPYLTDADILKIADWIDQGARDN
jgi:hypothetical protein